jgi:hypothetical protein
VYNPEADTVPPVVDHVTAVLLEPVTVAVNCWVAPVRIEAEVGFTETTTGAVTVTVADADFEVSATLTAVTVYVPGVAGAVNTPLLETDPPVVDQFTDVLLVPVTLAVNCWVAPAMTVAEAGLMVTATGTDTVTDAEADLLGSATLVAVTVYVPPADGAVYNPLLDIEPPLEDQFTAVFVEPETVAVNCWVAPDCNDVDRGLIVMATAATTLIVAVADLVGSATLVAVTV